MKFRRKTSINRYPDKRRQKILSRKKASFAEIFLRVIKAGFGRAIRAEVYRPRNGFQMFVFYLEGKERQLPIRQMNRFTPFFAEAFKIGVLSIRDGHQPLAYFRRGDPSLPFVVIVRRVSETGKREAFAAGDRVAADIVESCYKARLRAGNRN